MGGPLTAPIKPNQTNQKNQTMRTNLRALCKFAVLAGSLLGAGAYAQNDALLDILVANGTITRAQADEVRT